MTVPADTKAILRSIFGRLFQGEFATLDDIALSCRSAEGIDYLDGTAALSCWLEEEVSDAGPAVADPGAHAIHGSLYALSPTCEAVISGISRHLQALLLEGYPPPPATSMMRNRGVPDLAAHLVAPAALRDAALTATVERAVELSEHNGMRHTLIISSNGLVVVSGAPPFEAMAHWHNVEFAARVECLRIEESLLRREGGRA